MLSETSNDGVREFFTEDPLAGLQITLEDEKLLKELASKQTIESNADVLTEDAVKEEVFIEQKNPNVIVIKKKQKPGRKRKQKYIGVTFHKRNGKWVSQASENGRSKYLGTYASDEQAARVYDAYMVSRFGQEIKTNFPKEEVDFTLVPVLKRYRKRDSPFDITNFVSFPHNPLYPVEQAIFGDSKQFRDPNRPKNPRNAYMMFVARQRELIKAGEFHVPTPNNLGETSKLFGKMWKAMTPEEKQPFRDQATRDRVRFESQSKDYVANLKKRSQAQQQFHPFMMQGMMIPGMQQMMAPMQPMHLSHVPVQMPMTVPKLSAAPQLKQELPSLPPMNAITMQHHMRIQTCPEVQVEQNTDATVLKDE